MLAGVPEPTKALKKAASLGVRHAQSSEVRPGKRAILILSFGTTFRSSREKTIDAVAQSIREEFPHVRVVSAFSSHIVIRRIREKEGITYLTPEQALESLRADGFGEVAILSTDIIPGIEYSYALQVFEEFREKFHSLTLSTPLMYWQGQEERSDDVNMVIEALRPTLCHEEKEAVLLLAHGTPHAANAYYSVMQLKLWQKGLEQVFLYTVEGWPLLENIIPQLKEKKITKVRLVPFMLVAGEHANHDMAGRTKDSHKSILEREGFIVTVDLRGLGEYATIRQLFCKRAREAWNRC